MARLTKGAGRLCIAGWFVIFATLLVTEGGEDDSAMRQEATTHSMAKGRSLSHATYTSAHACPRDGLHRVASGRLFFDASEPEIIAMSHQGGKDSTVVTTNEDEQEWAHLAVPPHPLITWEDLPPVVHPGLERVEPDTGEPFRPG